MAMAAGSGTILTPGSDGPGEEQGQSVRNSDPLFLNGDVVNVAGNPRRKRTNHIMATKTSTSTKRGRKTETNGNGGTATATAPAEDGVTIEEFRALPPAEGEEGAANPAEGADEALPQVFLTVLESGEVDPRDLVIDETRNVRRFKHTPSVIQERATNMLAMGQISPITVTRTEEGRLTVEWGFLRALAGLYINEHGLTPEPWMLRYELVDPTDVLTHLLRGAAENIKRKEMGDVDLLHLFKRLKAEGLTQRQIAKRLDLSDASVSRVLGLEKLGERELRMTAQGTIPSEHARELATLPKEFRKPLVEKLAAGEKVTISEIKSVGAEARRAEKAADAEEGEGGEGKGKKAAKTGRPIKVDRALSAKQIMYPFEVVIGRNEGEAMDAVQGWCEEFMRFRNGEGNGRKLVRALYAMAGVDVPSWVKQIPTTA